MHGDTIKPLKASTSLQGSEDPFVPKSFSLGCSNATYARLPAWPSAGGWRLLRPNSDRSTNGSAVRVVRLGDISDVLMFIRGYMLVM